MVKIIVYVTDVDTHYQHAISAGAKILIVLEDNPYGGNAFRVLIKKATSERLVLMTCGRKSEKGMTKKDFKKEFRHLYQPSAKEVVEVDVPTANFLMIDGEGDPNTSQEYAQAVEALFAVSYAIKFKIKRGALALDYGVMPLEGLWWADDLSKFSIEDKTNWKWTMMIMQPSCVTPTIVEQALAEVAKKKSLAAISRLRMEAFQEGHSAQMLHIGPFANEATTIEKLHQFIAAKGKQAGTHHEIYLSDIRKKPAAKWKTILRLPMR